MYYDKKKIYIISATYVLALFFISFISDKLVGNLCLSALAVSGAIIGVFFIKKHRAVDVHKNEVAIVTALTAVLAVLTVSMLGLAFGFYKNWISLRIIYTYIVPITVSIISMEMFRSVLLGQKQKTIRVLSYFMFVFTDIILFADKSPFRSVSAFMSLFAFVFLPAFTSNLLYYKLSYDYGARSVIPYRLITALYSYVLPFGVNIPQALYSFIKIVFPLIVLWFIKLLYDKRTMNASAKRTPVRTVLTAICAVVMCVSIAFIANLFPYKPIVVASDSMKNELSRGDVVVYEEYEGQTIQNGQVILFKKNGSIIIHRVVDIKKINGVYRYYTKGDANNGVDTGYITNDDIVGVTTMKIKYIGYPTVWLYDIFRNKK